MNEEWKVKIPQFMTEAVNAISGTIRYFKLECKENKITADNPLIRRYFTDLPNA